MCVDFTARLLTLPVSHLRCVLCSLCRSKTQSDMAHFAQFDPPIPAQVAAMASALPSAFGGGGLGGGPPIDDAHSLVHRALGFSRVAPSFLPYP